MLWYIFRILIGVFWNSPKFVIDVPKWNGETAKEEVRFAFSLMQENKKNKATNEKLKPQIGIKWYQVRVALMATAQTFYC